MIYWSEPNPSASDCILVLACRIVAIVQWHIHGKTSTFLTYPAILDEHCSPAFDIVHVGIHEWAQTVNLPDFDSGWVWTPINMVMHIFFTIQQNIILTIVLTILDKRFSVLYRVYDQTFKFRMLILWEPDNLKHCANIKEPCYRCSWQIFLIPSTFYIPYSD